MGNHCEIYGTVEAGCEDPKVDLSRLAADVAVAQDMRFGKWTDETRVDEEKGRES
jgi:hypothetical protein